MSFRFAWAALLALALVGCPADELQGGRYACVPGGPADQCPGQWRCGFEGFCHEVGELRPWICADDSHCEGGWKCGLAASRDSGECHAVDAGGAYACHTSDQCSAGWHCGPALTCYDRTVKAPVACRPDAGDCADGWRCGLDGKCQDTGAPGAYLCVEADGGLDDAWCEQGWRCAPEGRCTNPSADSLGNGPVRAHAPFVVIHPVHPEPAPSLFSVSPTYESGLGLGRQTTAWVSDGGLFARVVDTRGGPSHGHALGAWEGGQFAAMGSRGEHSFPAFAPDDVARVVVARPDGGGTLFELSPTGMHSVSNQPFIYPATRLVMGSATPTLPPRILAFTPERPKQFNILAGAWETTTWHFFRTDFPSEEWDFPGNRIVDMATVHGVSGVDCVLAVDGRGMWASQKGFVGGSNVDSDFEAIEMGPFTNDFCRAPSAATHRFTALTSLGRDWVGATSVVADAGTSFVSLIDLRGIWSQNFTQTFCTTFAGGPCDTATRIPVDVRMGPCPVCTGGTVGDFAVVGDPTSPRVEVRCAGADGGTTGIVSLAPSVTGNGCVRTFPSPRNGLPPQTALTNAQARVGGVVAWASATGPFLWFGPSVAETRTELFDRPATAVAQTGPLLSNLVAFDGEDNAGYMPDAGFVSQGEGLEIVSAVAGAPSWVMSADRSVYDLADAGILAAAPVVAVIGTAVTPFAAPFQALLVSQGNGPARVLVASAGASLFHGEMDAVLAGETLFVRLALAAVAPSPIGSLAFPAKSPADAYLRGYAVTPNGVFRISAPTAARWDFTPVVLPAALVPREVWFEGTRGRVGFADGTVYALPSRVPIAPPLGDVVDYAQACDQQLALTATGLHRLVPSAGSTVGAWAPLALPAGFVEKGLEAGRLHAVDGAVYVFARTGETTRLAFDGCP